ncbi:MAG TPA: prepilin-type N-terminal cleavage/methylation domain-containing protein [Patescibacteria group bacterium]|nr:prepilin-type N-terminal cleavage/methylation domain-containing protein [Patescibacteria group bacterium]
MTQTNQIQKQGFTLIELLVVIAIIGLLSSTVMTTVSVARSKSRDARREADALNLLNALALEESTRGKLPCHKDYDSSENSNGSVNQKFMKFLVTDGYLAQTPRDPLNKGIYTYSYMTFSNVKKGPCGAVAYIDYTTENPITSCVGGGVLINNNHCHIFFPSPPNCPNWTDADLSDCKLKDKKNDY